MDCGDEENHVPNHQFTIEELRWASPQQGHKLVYNPI